MNTVWKRNGEFGSEDMEDGVDLILKQLDSSHCKKPENAAMLIREAAGPKVHAYASLASYHVYGNSNLVSEILDSSEIDMDDIALLANLFHIDPVQIGISAIDIDQAKDFLEIAPGLKEKDVRNTLEILARTQAEARQKIGFAMDTYMKSNPKSRFNASMLHGNSTFH